mmetsp:Transcript_6219/g.13484  ORF Transcript_6219/g.13484 Transcript_6219/m.13484 type:complete len:238 (+) Transcript_6219:487-1200(+)
MDSKLIVALDDIHNSCAYNVLVQYSFIERSSCHLSLLFQHLLPLIAVSEKGVHQKSNDGNCFCKSHDILHGSSLHTGIQNFRTKNKLHCSVEQEADRDISHQNFNNIIPELFAWEWNQLKVFIEPRDRLACKHKRQNKSCKKTPEKGAIFRKAGHERTTLKVDNEDGNLLHVAHQEHNGIKNARFELAIQVCFVIFGQVRLCHTNSPHHGYQVDAKLTEETDEERRVEDGRQRLYTG